MATEIQNGMWYLASQMTSRPAPTRPMLPTAKLMTRVDR